MDGKSLMLPNSIRLLTQGKICNSQQYWKKFVDYSGPKLDNDMDSIVVKNFSIENNKKNNACERD